MRSAAPMKAAKIGYLVISALLCMMGVLVIVHPEASMHTDGILCGLMLIAFGAIKLVGYFSKDLFRLAFENDLAGGILMMALGSCLFLHTKDTLLFFCTVLGILILSDGLFKVQIAVDAKRFGIDRWWAILLAAACAGVLGVLLVLRPGEGAQALTMLLGASLFLDGVMNLLVALLTVKIIRHQQPDVIETDEFEIK